MQIVHKQQQVQTRDGSLCLYAKDEVLFSDADRPVLLMIHGAFRQSAHLFPWAALDDSCFDLVFVDLPGHGQSPAVDDVTVEGFAANVRDAIAVALGQRRVVAVGESLGGLVALALGGLGIEQLKGVVAADPPLSMTKLWHIRDAICSAVAGDQANQFLLSFAMNIFGIPPDGSVHERLYYHLIENSKVPVLVLTGDVPLFPVRSINAVPCLIDDVDRYVIDHLSGNRAHIQTVPGCGHLLLIEGMQQCRSIIKLFCDAVGHRYLQCPAVT